MSNEDIERILNYTTTMKSGTPYLEIVELIDEYKNQQKEIEELKEKEKNLIFQLKDEEKELIEVTDKIREKINYYRKYCGYDGVTMIGNTQLKELEELLEEN